MRVGGCELGVGDRGFWVEGRGLRVGGWRRDTPFRDLKKFLVCQGLNDSWVLGSDGISWVSGSKGISWVAVSVNYPKSDAEQ